MHEARIPTRILDPEFLLNAYQQGYFPMADPQTGEIHWFSPDPRTIIDLTDFRTSRSLRQVIRKGVFELRIDADFSSVIRRCGERPDTWISSAIVESYCRLHELGFAHSVETWRGGRLAGGLYGVSLGGAFFGESMFSLERDASKVALVALVQRMRERGFTLLDTQFMTPHLARFGAKEIPREHYLQQLHDALALSCRFM